MKAFADLIERLAVTRDSAHQVTLLTAYLRLTPDPERGLALGLMTGLIEAKALRPAVLKALLEARCDPTLLALSLEYVGDLSETAALLWPSDTRTNQPPPSINDVLDTVKTLAKDEVPAQVCDWLDACDPINRRVLLKLLGGNLRIGLSSRAIKTAVARLSDGRLTTDAVEEIWPALHPPFKALFDWVEGRTAPPDTANHPTFVRPQSAEVLAPEALPTLEADGLFVEFKWSGQRVQWVQRGGKVKLFSAQGDDLSAAFPELLTPLVEDATIDAQLTVSRLENGEERLGTADDLTRRMRRKTVTKAVLTDRPAKLRAFDLLSHRGEDLRALPLLQRRIRLEELAASVGLSLSPLQKTEDLAGLHAGLAQIPGAEGLILKPQHATMRDADSPWRVCLPTAHRFKGVLLYVQRSGGGVNAPFAEFTLGALTPPTTEADEPGLIPIAKVQPSLDPEDLALINRFVRDNTLERFGPVRSIRAELVIEVSFDRIEESSRRKSGVRLHGLRTQKLHPDTPWQQADELQSLHKLIA